MVARSPFDIAATMLGKGEVPDRATLQEFMRSGGANLDPVTTAWCAAFVNSSLAQAGVQGTGSNLARSFMNFGEAVDKPQRGDLAVFSRGDPNGMYGHVGFFDSVNPDGTIKVLGGNQGNSVSYADYGADRLLGYRRAPGGQGPALAPATAPATLSGPQAASANATERPGAVPGPAQQAFGDVVAPRAPVSFASIIDNYSRQRRASEEEHQARQARLAELFAVTSA